MRIRCALLVCLCLLLSARAEAQFRPIERGVGEDFHVELGLMFWTPTPALQIQTGSLAALGQPAVDFVNEFGIQSTHFNEFRSVIKAGRKTKIRVSHVVMQYNEAATLQRTITFGGSTFPVSAPATADLKWEFWNVGYEWDFIAYPRAVIGMITAVKFNKISADLTATGYGSSVTDVNAPIPALGFTARIYPHKLFSVTTEFSGFKVPGFIGKKISDSVGDDFDARMWEFDFYGTMSFSRYIGAQAGYRRVTASYLIDPDAGDLKMSGLYFGGVLRF